MQSAENKIRELENEIATLPVGYISNKKINGKIQQYLQWTENGKKKSRYLDRERAEELKPLIERRRKLLAEVKSLKKTLSSAEESSLVSDDYPIRNILLSEELSSARTLYIRLSGISVLKQRRSIRKSIALGR